MSTLHEAAVEGNLGELTRLIEAGADVNAQDDCVRLLIKAGADVNARDSDGSSALKLAQSGGHGGCAALLRAVGARE